MILCFVATTARQTALSSNGGFLRSCLYLFLCFLDLIGFVVCSTCATLQTYFLASFVAAQAPGRYRKESRKNGYGDDGALLFARNPRIIIVIGEGLDFRCERGRRERKTRRKNEKEEEEREICFFWYCFV